MLLSSGRANVADFAHGAAFDGRREGSQSCPQVPILEASYGAFHCMLQFIYGGATATDVGEELAVELLGLADRYLLDGPNNRVKLLCLAAALTAAYRSRRSLPVCSAPPSGPVRRAFAV